LRDNPEFYAAKKRGGMAADIEVVNSTFKNATGYEYTKVEKTFDKNGRLISQKLTTDKVKGDITAQIFWLTNRQPDYWKHMNRIQLEHSGDVTHSHFHKLQDIPVEELSEEAQKMLFEINMKQLAGGRGN
jgi:hypothetical protein